MGRPECLVFFLLLILAACDDAGERGPVTEDRDSDEHFSEFARALFVELRNEPLDSERVDVGLFGDLFVHAGDRLVMGRYRYRVDSTARGPVGSMAFQLRDASRNAEPIPIVITFARADNAWRVERATFGDAASVSSPQVPGDAGDHKSHDATVGQDQTPLHQRLRTRLDAWVEAAVDRVGTISMD